ncbi:MAG: hypothetical protein QOD41_3880 [Cryptosporangiaceae bacterium]|nr:hypothetical protein [Cryptosporangiaceae bacterium]
MGLRRKQFIAGAAALVVAAAGLSAVYAANAGTAGYEAEGSNGTLAGGARVIPCAGCEGGKAAGWIGKGGTLTLGGLTSSTAGPATLTIAYASAQPRTAAVSVNGATASTLSFTATSNWVTPAKTTLRITAKAGPNTVSFANPAGYAPDIDKVWIDPLAAGACSDWSAATTYAAGDVISYQGKTYTALFGLTAGKGVTWTPDTSPQLWKAGGTCTGLVPAHPPKFAAPEATWQEHWFEHNGTVNLIAYNDTVAIYFDADVKPDAAKWMLPYLTNMWSYAQRTYGVAGNTKLTAGRLFSIHHENKLFGGHPSTMYDASHDFRNVSDVGGRNWTTPQYEVVTHETGHVVESTASGKHGSPAFPLWQDSKWMEFYIYDAYVALGMTAEAKAFYDKNITKSDSFPAANTHWFRDWFYPLWRDHGHAQVMVKYFQLLGSNFPTRGENFSRNLNWGEFVHFMSGAAGVDLRAQATTAFGWPASYEAQFQQARKDFPNVKY